MTKNSTKLMWFTLVELIVVITIVGILSTVWFVSYSGYLTWARDSNRISQLTKLSDSLQVYSASKTLPLPDDSIDVTANGASNVIAYQWYVWVDVLETIDYTNGWKDPKDDEYYTYYLTKDRSSLQLMAMMEEQQSVTFNALNKATANYEERYPKVYGRKLWVLTYSDDTDTTLYNTPAQEITANAGWLDIVTTDVEYTANITDSNADKISGTGAELRAVNPDANCKRIKQTGWSDGNWIYTISPVGTSINVYCDMETNWGGWTMVARSVEWATGTFNLSSETWSVWEDSNPYTIIVSSLIYEEEMLGSYTKWKIIKEFVAEDDTSADLTASGWTLWVSLISWGILNWDPGMLFVK